MKSRQDPIILRDNYLTSLSCDLLQSGLQVAGWVKWKFHMRDIGKGYRTVDEPIYLNDMRISHAYVSVEK